MAIDSFPNIPHNNRVISLAENEQLWAGTPSGLVGFTGQTPIYADSSGKQVKVRAGIGGRLRGTRWNDAAGTTIGPFGNNTSGKPRIDLVSARLNRPGGYVVGYNVTQGAPADNPIAPLPTRNDTLDGSGFWDQPLAEVRIANNYTTIAATDVTNRAWWITASGYHGFDAAKPPPEPGVLFRANDSGITYIGTASAWQRLYFNTGWKALTAPTGYTFGAMHVARSGDLVVLNARVIVTRSNIGANVDLKFGTLDSIFLPDMNVWGPYHCTLPPHSSHAVVQPSGVILFAGTSTTINTGANLIANMSWLAAN